MRGENEPQGNIDWLVEYNLKLEDKVSCDQEKCLAPATHWARVNCCGGVMLTCMGHMHLVVRSLVSMINNRSKVVCQFCRKSSDPTGWLNKPQEL